MIDSRTEFIWALEELQRRSQIDMLKYIRWLPAQDAFLRNTSRRRLLRAGNQAHGKTTAGLAEVIYMCLGQHPYKKIPLRPPIEAWILAATWSQSVAIQNALWRLLPKKQIAEGTVWDEINGIHGRNPAIKFNNNSIIRIKTTGQGGLALSGATIHVALFDEPPQSMRIYSEVQKRVLRTNGYILLTLTPINAPVDWLKELVDRGQITDLHYPMRPEYLIPIGATRPLCLEDGTPMDAEWIERLRRETMSIEAPVVIDGEWELRSITNVFHQWDPVRHISASMLQGPAELCLGIDYGSKEFKQYATLVAVQSLPDGDRVHVLDETVGPGNTDILQDAQAILDMLSRNGVSWPMLDRAWGDRIYVRGVEKKSNRDMMDSVCRLLQVKLGSLQPYIRTAKRGEGRVQGSIMAGCRYIHRCMVRRDSSGAGHFSVHPRCKRLIDALTKWDFTDSEWKDPIDALRMALTDFIFRKARREHEPKVYLY